MSDALRDNPTLEDLALAAADGSLDAAGWSQLNALLAAAPAARERYVHILLLTDALRHQHPAAAEQPAPVIRTNSFRIPRIAYALAALLLLAAAAVAVYFATLTPDPRPLTPDSSPLATVIETTGTLIVNDTIVNSGDEIHSGDLSLDTGSADFRLINGVNVSLRGDTQLAVHNPMSATLTRGSAAFDCPHAAKGFSVHLPVHATVVDLGTRFRVAVDPSNVALVAVTEGKVRIEWSDAGGDPRTATVAAGVSARLTPDAHGRVAVAILPATRLELIDDPDNSTPTKVGTVADTTDDPFAYDPLNPTSPMPVLVYHDPTHGYHGYHAYQPEGADVVLSYTLDPVTLSADQTFVIDLYGRDISLRRDKNIDINLYRGGYDDADRVATARGLIIPESPRHLRLTSRAFGVDLTGVAFDRIQVVGHDSDGDPRGSYFTLLEVCAAVVRNEPPAPPPQAPQPKAP